MNNVIIIFSIALILCGCGYVDVPAHNDSERIQSQIDEVQKQLDELNSSNIESSNIEIDVDNETSTEPEISTLETEQSGEFTIEKATKAFYNFLNDNGYEVSEDQIETSLMDGDLWMDAFYAADSETMHASPIAHGRMNPKTGIGVYWSIITDNMEISVDYNKYNN